MQRQKWEVVFAILIISLALGSSLHFIYMGWVVDDRGFSITSHNLPYWDFSNLWAGGKIAASGNISHLFDVQAYRADLRSLLSPFITSQEWSYPPSMLLLGYPLALIPIFPAYLIWTVGTSLLFLMAMRLLDLPWAICAIVALSPAAMVNTALGQNGALTAALLMGGLCLAPARPVLAGILLGLLTIKPQLGLIVPFCLLASRNYRAIASATIVAVFLVLLSGLLFGFSAWKLFWTETRPLMTAILEAPYPQTYQVNAVNFFVTARWLGMSVFYSYLFQGVFSLLSIATAIWMWARDDRVDPHLRACLTALLAIAATPYGYTYDVLPMSATIAILFLSYRSPSVVLLAVAWVFPPLNQYLPISIGILFPVGIAVLALRQQRRVAVQDARSSPA